MRSIPLDVTAISAAPAWSVSGRRTSSASAQSAVRTLDPRLVTAGILVGLVAALAFRGPITELIGTAPTAVPRAVVLDLPPLITSEPHDPLPRAGRATRSPAAHPPRDPFLAFPRAGDSAGRPAASRGDRVQTGHSYRVRSGDSLWAIASRELAARSEHAVSTAAVARASQRLFAGNRATIGADPSTLLRGVVLDLGALRG